VYVIYLQVTLKLEESELEHFLHDQTLMSSVLDHRNWHCIYYCTFLSRRLYHWIYLSSMVSSVCSVSDVCVWYMYMYLMIMWCMQHG